LLGCSSAPRPSEWSKTLADRLVFSSLDLIGAFRVPGRPDARLSMPLRVLAAAWSPPPKETLIAFAGFAPVLRSLLFDEMLTIGR
jgi:hypothetical protein